MLVRQENTELRALEMAFLINPNLNTVSNGVFFFQ